MFKVLLPALLLSASIVSANDLMTPMELEDAQNFTLVTPTGEELSLDDYSGKYVLVNFWAHWCSPCIKEFPDMQELYETVDKSKLEIIGIHAGPYNNEAAEFVKHFGITFPIVSDPDTSLKGWEVPALPMTYLVNPEGKLAYKAIGPRDWDYEQMNVLITD